jgi:uncharacterized protein (DUF1015 family)
MADIKEFKGFRPDKGLAEKISSLPYDVFSDAEARGESAIEPMTFLRITRPEIDLAADINFYSDAVYNKGKENLKKYIDDGILKEDSSPCFYLYTLEMNGRSQTGLVATVSIDDYINEVIKKHELTRVEKENDRIRHLDIVNAHTGLVYLLYKEDNKSIFSDYKKIDPVYDFYARGGVRHIFRVIDDPAAIGKIKKALSDKNLYIADGHHRAASAVNVGLARRKSNAGHAGSENYNYFLSVIFPHNELMIMPYNRVVKDLNGLSSEAFIAKISENFSVAVSGVKSPEKMHEFSMYLNSEWFTVKPEFKLESGVLDQLDAKILQDKILSPVLGINDPRKDKRIDFIGGIRGTDELEKRVDSGMDVVAFSMFPTVVDQLIKVSDAGELMPPKSTWFEPKLRDGLVVNCL